MQLANAVEEVAPEGVIGGPNTAVETERDWYAVGQLLNICAKFFPKEIDEYLKLNKVIKASQANQYGLLEDPTTKKGGEAHVRQIGTWPAEFEYLVKIVWPRQKFDRKFNRELFKRFPVLQTALKI